MDLFNGSKISSNDETSVMCSSKRAQFLATYRRQQTWSLPYSIIYYITKNPSSSKCYAKMFKSCKYFFLKNPILIVQELIVNRYNTEWNYFNEEQVDAKNISSKIWVTFEFNGSYRPLQQNYVNSIIPKIYKSDIKEITLSNQNIDFQDLKFLATKCEYFWFDNVTVMNENGSIIALEKLVETFTNVKIFRSSVDHMVTLKTVAELLKVPHFSQLDVFELHNIPETFDIETFYSHIKKNKKTDICLNFCDDISEAYKSRLQGIVNEIVATVKHEYKIPLINFPGIDETSGEKLLKLYEI